MVFRNETGITDKDWLGVHWGRWGDALREAGFKPNKFNTRRSKDDLMEHLADAIRHFGKVPSEADLRMFGRERPDFPGHSTFHNNFGSKKATIEAFRDWAQDKREHSDLLAFLPDKPHEPEARESTREGFVYLLKSGAHYKIGRSENLEKRVKQVSVAMPEELTLEHAIRTDDPPGIEAYWHKRFAERRANGEWFRLDSADIKAFKRRKFQ